CARPDYGAMDYW
nr:immunoglobulin heavy chain junction region [Mus musculus]MBK4195354.1 immunoglobulin heavy chain junction region [Mus musculus]